MLVRLVRLQVVRLQVVRLQHRREGGGGGCVWWWHAWGVAWGEARLSVAPCLDANKRPPVDCGSGSKFGRARKGSVSAVEPQKVLLTPLITMML